MSPLCPLQRPRPVPSGGDAQPLRSDSFEHLQQAYASESELPVFWTPAYVEKRLIEAAYVSDRSTKKPGPKAFGNNWPDIMMEFSEVERFEAERNAFFDERQFKPDAAAVSRADEALAWIPAYVRHPLQCDAIRLYAAGKAFGIPVEPLLANRMKRARRGMPRALLQINADREQQRRRLAAQFAAEANERMANLAKRRRRPLTAEQQAFIKADVQQRLNEACQPFLRMEKDDIRPHHALPGKCLAPATYHRMRKAAAAAIADALNFAEVPIR